MSFRPEEPRVWNGRYRRVPGEQTVFHVRNRPRGWWPVIEWTRQGETATCEMVDDGSAEALAAAVNAGKAASNVGPGGSFLVNEHGRVLLPAHDRVGTRVMTVGVHDGPLCFDNPFRPDRPLDLYDDETLESGGLWDRPYIGLRHNLSRSGTLYFWHEDSTGARALQPPAQDQALIRALRSIRPTGAVRFLVGPGGVVITKVEVSSVWEARYVGRVDLSTWFTEEA